MTPRFSIQAGLGLLLLAHAAVAPAQAEPAGDGAAVAASRQPAEAGTEVAGPVLLELLEFIGEFSGEDGEWVDPSVLLELDADELAGTTRGESRVLGTAEEEQPESPVENCRTTRCE